MPVERRTGNYARRRSGRYQWFAAPGIVYLAVFFGYPLVVLVQMSLSKVSLGTAVSGRSVWVGLDNFRAILTGDDFIAAVPRTLIFVLVTVVAVLVLGLALALILNEKLPGIRVARFLIFFAWLFPPVVTGALWRNMLNGTSDGLLNHLLLQTGVITEPIAFLVDPGIAFSMVTALTVWSSVPFAGLVLTASLQDVPKDLYEAAQLDGAGPRERFWCVTLPAIRPALLMLTILESIYSYKVFDIILVLTAGGPGTTTSTVPFLAYISAFGDNDFGQASAYGVIGILVGVAIAFPYIVRVRRLESRS